MFKKAALLCFSLKLSRGHCQDLQDNMLLCRHLNQGAEVGAQVLSRAGSGGHAEIALHMSKRGEKTKRPEEAFAGFDGELLSGRS